MAESIHPIDTEQLASEMEEDLFDYAENRGFGDLHIKFDRATGLRAIVAIHSTKLGPALGGCRCIAYDSNKAALIDAMRLARAMSYKAALVNLPLGGGKSVLMLPSKEINDRRAYFNAYGQFIADLNGRYITAVDSGTSIIDMDYTAEKTFYVATTSKNNGEPSPFTARGIRRGIEAAVQFKLGKHSLAGIRVAIQGVGKVGYFLAEELYAQGALLTVTDVNQNHIERCVREFQATVVSPEQIHSADVDVFAPCALGAVINDTHIQQLKAPIIAGAANNQLAHAIHGKLLHEKNILYAPDYVINAGGLIYAYGQYVGLPLAELQNKVEHIYQSLLTIFERSKRENKATSEIADAMAQERLA